MALRAKSSEFRREAAAAGAIRTGSTMSPEKAAEQKFADCSPNVFLRWVLVKGRMQKEKRQRLIKNRFRTLIPGSTFLIFTFLFIVVASASATMIFEVPFISQAPFYDWSEPWQSFCEEASVVMAAHFLWGLPISPKIAAEEMLIIKEYEELVFGKYKDTNAEETAEILRELYGFNNILVKEVKSSGEIEKELSRGKIIIAPVAGRFLGNPYFIPPGPIYHMLVIKGFNGEYFFTNDPGTRRGENLKYRKDVLFNAIYDLGGLGILSGEKIIIVVGV